MHNEYNNICHYSTTHAEEYAKIPGRWETELGRQSQNMSTEATIFLQANIENDAAVEASYVVSEMIVNVGKQFKEGEFVKKSARYRLQV